MPTLVRSHQLSAQSGLIELVGLEVMSLCRSRRPLPNSDASRQRFGRDVTSEAPAGEAFSHLSRRLKSETLDLPSMRLEGVQVISVRINMSP